MARKDSLIKLKAVLVKRREALRKALDGDLSLLMELTEQSGDVVDFASDTSAGEITSQLAEVESRELKQIDRALSRLESGEYGECEICLGKIPLSRLQVLPYATMCISCQREVEKHGDIERGDADWSRIVDMTQSDRDLNVSDLEYDVN